MIRVADEQPQARSLDPIVDPWVEEYETTRKPAPSQPAVQADLYDRAEPVDDYDDRDHRRSGWSLFGRKRAQAPQPTYSPRPTAGARTAAQPAPEPEAGQADDDLEIPSFLRRLAN